MPEKITPEEAVRRAFWMVKLPSMAVLLLPMVAVVILMKLGRLPQYGPAGAKWAVPVLVGAIVGGWLVWSIQVPRWRLWAYRAVDDIQALKRLAVARQIIWPEGSIFEKTEIASRRTRAELQQLERSRAKF